MVYLNFTVAGVALGLLLGGRLSTLSQLRIRRLGLAYAAVLVQFAAFPFRFFPWSTPDGAARILWLVSYTLLLAFVLANVRMRGVVLVGAGIVCNVIAIVANDGLMPATQHALRAAGALAHQKHYNSVTLTHPHVALLVDRFAWPQWLPLANVFSVGDVLIGAGLLVLIVTGMRPRLFHRASDGRTGTAGAPAAAPTRSA